MIFFDIYESLEIHISFEIYNSYEIHDSFEIQKSIEIHEFLEIRGYLRFMNLSNRDSFQRSIQIHDSES